ncbi:hypothetical protein FG379_001568 [Cryptosporidium bovis]|uniref:uncharacterized protein n=1 Tax=Cryptosporidium bovis TaxID=310047 RepID=UPI00351A3361|nr:hypothetical protein FG379_001568 [Cryptosporidium bovis]
MPENGLNCKYITRRYSLSNSEKTTIGKSLLRYIQVSHYFKKPTISTINENKRQELINKHRNEIEEKNIQEVIRINNNILLNEVNNTLSECIREDVNINNIDKQTKWLNQLINGNPPIQKSANIDRKIKPNDGKNLFGDKYKIYDELNTNIDKNLHIKSDKGFPVLNYQYNNVEDTVLKWNPPKYIDNYKNRNFKRKLRVLKDNESNNDDDRTNNINHIKDNKNEKSALDEDTLIPVIGELKSESEMNKKSNMEEKLYIKQYYDEIKSNNSLLEYIKEKNGNNDEFNSWLENTQTVYDDDDDDDDYNNKNENEIVKGNLSFSPDKNAFIKIKYDDEALDLHLRNDYRRFDIILNSNLFGYCDFDDPDGVITNILKIGNNCEVDSYNDDDKKAKSEANSKANNGKDGQDGENKSKEIKKDINSKHKESMNEDDHKSKKSFVNLSKNKILAPKNNIVKGMNNNVSNSNDHNNSIKKKKEMDTNIINGINYNSLINMLLKAGAEVDEDEEKIIKEEKDQLKKLKLPCNNMNYKTSLLNIEREEKVFTEEETKEYYDKKRKNRIEIRKKVLEEEKYMKDYSIKLLYDNPVMLQAYIQKMDNEIEIKKKKYEQEKNDRIHLSYQLKFMIERNSELMISNNNIKNEIERLKNDYSYKMEYINEYSNKLNSELNNLENIYQILINSLGMLCQWCVCEPEYLDPECTKEWESSSVTFLPGGRASHALLLCKRICEFDKRLSALYKSMYIHNYKNGLKILKKRSKSINTESISPSIHKEKDELNGNV